MNSRFKMTLILPLLGMLAGCDERAIEFAKKTQDLLSERSKLLERKIASEQQAYKDLARVFVEAPRTQSMMMLANEQTERSAELSADYLEGREPISHWRGKINEFRKLVAENRSGTLRAELDQTAKQLAALEALRVEQDQVAALQKLLAVLIKKPTLAEQIAALNSFREDVVNDYDKLVCDGIKARIADAKTSAEDKTTLEDLQKEKSCK